MLPIVIPAVIGIAEDAMRTLRMRKDYNDALAVASKQQIQEIAIGKEEVVIKFSPEVRVKIKLRFCRIL